MDQQDIFRISELLRQANDTLRAISKTLEAMHVGESNHKFCHRDPDCTFTQLQQGFQSQYVNPDAQPAIDTQAHANRVGTQGPSPDAQGKSSVAPNEWDHQGCQYDVTKTSQTTIGGLEGTIGTHGGLKTHALDVLTYEETCRKKLGE